MNGRQPRRLKTIKANQPFIIFGLLKKFKSKQVNYKIK